MIQVKRRPWWRVSLFVFVMLVVEFLDELTYSAGEASWPLIRDAFDINYAQIGLLVSVPALFATFIEPIIGLVADTGKRRQIIVMGGVLFGLGFILQGLSPTYEVFMLASILQGVSGGAFVFLSQAALMDTAPDRRENNMALWTFSGSLAVVTGPLVLAAMLALGSSWRVFFIIGGGAMVLVALAITRLPAHHALRTTPDSPIRSMRENLRDSLALFRKGEVWRWMVLLEFSDFMLDVLFSLLALYMVDVVGVSKAQAGIAIAVWTGVGLIGDFLLIPILERIPGLVYLRVSVLMELLLYPMFLLVDAWTLKLVLLGLIGLFNAGWYAILQGKLYDALGEQSGAMLIIGNTAAIFGVIIPVALGLISETYGLDASMWLLMAGPIALMIGLPRYQGVEGESDAVEQEEVLELAEEL